MTTDAPEMQPATESPTIRLSVRIEPAREPHDLAGWRLYTNTTQPRSSAAIQFAGVFDTHEAAVEAAAEELRYRLRVAHESTLTTGAPR